MGYSSIPGLAVAAIITHQQQVPPDVVLMPGGHGMPISQLFAEHGDDLTPFANTKVAVATPRLTVGGELDDTVQATIGLAIGYVTFLVTKSLDAEKYLAPPITGFVAKDAAHWVEHHLEHGSDVRVYTLGELFPSIGHEAKNGWAVSAAAGREVTAREARAREEMMASAPGAREERRENLRSWRGGLMGLERSPVQCWASSGSAAMFVMLQGSEER